MKKKSLLFMLCFILIISNVNIKAMAGEYKPEPSADVALNILKYAAKINTIAEDNLYWLDQNYDGIVSAEDALIVLQKVAKLNVQIVFANKIDDISENAEKLEVVVSDIIQVSSQEEHGMYLLRTVADYQGFMNSLKEPVGDAWQEYNFDKSFFESKSLIAVLTTKGSDDISLNMNDVYKYEDTLQISYTIIQPEIPSLGLTGHLIFIAVEDADIYGVNNLSEHVIWKQKSNS